MRDIYAELAAIFREVFEDEGIVLRPDSTAVDVREWDSLSHVLLVLAVERVFGLELSPPQVANLENVGAFVELISAGLPASRSPG